MGTIIMIGAAIAGVVVTALVVVGYVMCRSIERSFTNWEGLGEDFAGWDDGKE